MQSSDLLPQFFEWRPFDTGDLKDSGHGDCSTVIERMRKVQAARSLFVQQHRRQQRRRPVRVNGCCACSTGTSAFLLLSACDSFIACSSDGMRAPNSSRIMSFSLLTMTVAVFAFCASVSGRLSVSKPVPVVMWHGMGDTCCSSGSLGKIISLLQDQIPGVYVRSLKFGKSATDDLESGYFGQMNERVADVCRSLALDPELKDGYHAIGFSQGGQFLRAVAQRCPSPRIRNLITLGAQHQGVSSVPRCTGTSLSLCQLAAKLINFGAYTSFVQQHSVQAQYWNDPLDQQNYREKSIFLADINNEREPRNQSYVDNLLKLDNLVLVQFEGDTIVIPRESETFGFYESGQRTKILPMNQTDLYRADRIGLRTLDQSGRLVIYRVPGNHLQLDMKWFTDELIAKYVRTQ